MGDTRRALGEILEQTDAARAEIERQAVDGMREVVQSIDTHFHAIFGQSMATMFRQKPRAGPRKVRAVPLATRLIEEGVLEGEIVDEHQSGCTADTRLTDVVEAEVVGDAGDHLSLTKNEILYDTGDSGEEVAHETVTALVSTGILQQRPRSPGADRTATGPRAGQTSMPALADSTPAGTLESSRPQHEETKEWLHTQHEETKEWMRARHEETKAFLRRRGR